MAAKLTLARVQEILSEEDLPDLDRYYDNAYQGLQIIGKYFPNKVLIVGAKRDIIFSVAIEEAIEAGITEEDVIELRRMNWMEDYESFACFV